MAKYPAGYMIAFYIGEGMSGVVPSLLGLGQGAGGDTCSNSNSTGTDTSGPRFSTSIYFGLLSLMVAISGVAYYLLNNLNISLSERYKALDRNSPTENEGVQEKGGSESEKGGSGTEASDSINMKQLNVKDVFCPSYQHRQEVANVRVLFINMYLIIGIMCALGNGMIPAISAYAYLPYGPTTYHLAVELALLANPIVCFASFYLATKNPKVLNVVTTFAVGIAVVIIYTATMSPTPWMMDSTAGSVLIILICVCWTGCISYVKLCVASILREYGENALIWCGFVTQLGSFIGAVIIFVISFKTKTFTPC